MFFVRSLSGQGCGVRVPNSWVGIGINSLWCDSHFSRTPPTSSCISTPLLLSIQAAMKTLPPFQVLPV